MVLGQQQAEKLIRAEFEKCKNITFIENMVCLKSSLKPSQLVEIDAMVSAIVDTMPNISI